MRCGIIAVIYTGGHRREGGREGGRDPLQSEEFKSTVLVVVCVVAQ